MLNKKGFTSIELVVVLVALTVAVSIVSTSLYGLYLAFSASVLLGFVVLIIEPAPFIIGIVMLLTGSNLAQRILELFL